MLRVPTFSTLRTLFNTIRSNFSWGSLPRERVAEVLSLYPLSEIGEPISCAFLGGTYSHNWLLRTTVGQKVLKKYRYNNLSSILPEHSILVFLAGHDFPAPRLLPNAEGQTYSEVNGQFWSLYDFIPGFRYTDFYYFSRRSDRFFLKEAAQTLARYHRLMDGFSPPGRKLNGFKEGGQELWRDCEWHLGVLAECEARLGEKRRLDETDRCILNNLGRLKEGYARLGKAFETTHHQLSKVVIHGDYAPHNILFDARGLVAVLDFGSARLDVKVRDVARALETFTRQRLSRLQGWGIDYERAQYLLSVYQAYYPLSSVAIEALPHIWQLTKIRTLIWAIREHPARPLNLEAFHRKLHFLDWLTRNESELMATLRTVCPL